MKCDICHKDFEELQTFTVREPEQTLKLCREDYDHLVSNYKVTGKLVPKHCKACKNIIGWEWMAYKAPGRKRKGVAGNSKLDVFFDMRTPLERALNEKKKGGKKSEHGNNIPAEARADIQREVQADDTAGLEDEEGTDAPAT